jgi:tetratricopeptide (TPR) repeat protein
MKHFLLKILLVVLIIPVFGQNNKPDQNKYNLANSFYQNKEYSKAAPLFQELYEKTNLDSYFELYVNCLVLSENFEEAEKVMKKEIRRNKTPNNYITLGFIYKSKNDLVQAHETYDKVIENLTPNVGSIVSIANSFFNRNEYEYAEKTYQKGREIIPGEKFRNYIATVYAYLRDYEKMMNEYLLMLSEDENNLSSVESRIGSLLRFDFDNTLRTLVKKETMKCIQESPNLTAYNRLLIWLFVQEGNFKNALNQSISLDRRTLKEENSILEFSQSAVQSSQFEIALSGYDYLIGRKPAPTNLISAKLERVKTEYLDFIATPTSERKSFLNLEKHFQMVFDEFGYNRQTAGIAVDYAHYLAFYLKETNKAFSILDTALMASAPDNNQRFLLKTELADLNVYTNNLWEAILLYAQIIDANKDNPIGDEVKLKKAKLSFYLGDIEWAKSQLDVIKASTSKLTANDAMELSILITENYEMDSIAEPIQMYARADLLIFRNQDSLAIVTLDSLLQKYQGTTLTDKVLMKKAQIFKKNFRYSEAANLYSTIVTDYSFSSSADDALFNLASITENQLKNPEKANEYYKQIMVSYPGSIFVAEAREKFRIYRGDIPQPTNDPFNLFDQNELPRSGE